MARHVVAWLRDQQWEVYQEVALHSGVADIVAVQRPLVWIVEAKLTLGLDVLAQASRWVGLAHKVSAAVLWGSRRRNNEFVSSICAWRGIGLMLVSDRDYGEAWSSPVREDVQARLHRRVNAGWASRLVPEQQTYAEAGNSAGQRWSPFKATCREVLRVVRQQPGIQVKALIEQVSHHYNCASTARSCIMTWAVAGKIPGVEVRVEGRSARFYPCSEGSDAQVAGQV